MKRLLDFDDAGASDYEPAKGLTVGDIRAWHDHMEMTRKGLEAAIRAAKLALFVINKQGVMPNDSWKSGFDADLKTAESALAAAGVQHDPGR